MHSHTFAWFHDLLYPQEAQLSPRSRAMLHVIEYFAKSLKITQGRWKWYYLKVWIRFSIFSFHNNYGRILSRFDTTHDRDGHSGNQPPQDGVGRAWASRGKNLSYTVDNLSNTPSIFPETRNHVRFIISVETVKYLSQLLVCSCSSEQDESKSCECIFMKFSGGVAFGKKYID